MFNNKILILINFLIILVIILYFQTKKNKKEHFTIYEEDEYITNISGIRHNIVPDQTGDKCPNEKVLLNKSKDNIVYNKFCYEKGKQNPTEKKKFVDNIQTIPYNKNYEEGSFDTDSKRGIIKSDSDYLGCYLVPENLQSLINDKNLTVENNYKSMSDCKDFITDEKAIFFNSKITDKLMVENEPVAEKDAKNKKKSFCSTIEDTQYQTLLKDHRVEDKFCLGNSDVIDGKVKNYLGGIDTIAIYKHKSKTITNIGKPTVVRKSVPLKSNLDCSQFVSLKCLQTFKQHVLAWYDMDKNYKIKVKNITNGNYDWDDKTLNIGSQTHIHHNTDTVPKKHYNPAYSKYIHEFNYGTTKKKYYVFETNILSDNMHLDIHFWGNSSDYVILIDINDTSKFIYKKKNFNIFLHILDNLKQTYGANGIEPIPPELDKFEESMKQNGVANHLWKCLYNDYWCGSKWTNDITKATKFKIVKTPREPDYFYLELDPDPYGYQAYISKHIIGCENKTAKELDEFIKSANQNYHQKIIKTNFYHYMPYGCLNRYKFSGKKFTLKMFDELNTEYTINNKYHHYENHNKPTANYTADHTHEEHIDKKTFLLYDCSGNNNHMFPNYNKLHFIGNFKFKETTGTLLDDYTYRNAEGTELLGSSHINTFKNLASDLAKTEQYGNYFAIRKKNPFIINKAEFTSIHSIPSFDDLVSDSLTLRGDNEELPYLGMPEWNFDLGVRSRVPLSQCHGGTWDHSHHCSCGHHDGNNCDKQQCHNQVKLQEILDKPSKTDISKGTYYPNPLFFSVTEILNSKHTDSFEGYNGINFSLEAKKKMFFESSNELVKKLQKQFLISFSYNPVKIEDTSEFSLKNQDIKKNLIGNPVLSLCSNFQSDVEESTLGGGYKQSGFLWSFMDSYDKTDEGLLHVCPKKVGLILIQPGNNSKLCLSDIQIFDKLGNIINIISSSIKIIRKNELYKQDNDEVLENKEENKEEKKEKSFCFTYNPHSLTMKLPKKSPSSIPVPFRILYETSTIIPTKSVEGFKLSDASNSYPWGKKQHSSGHTHDVSIKYSEDKKKIVKEGHAGAYFYRKISVDATKDDWYMLVFKNPKYISRIVVKSPISDVTYSHSIKADAITSKDTVDILNYPGEKIDNSFKETTMKLIDSKSLLYNEWNKKVWDDTETLATSDGKDDLVYNKNDIVNTILFKNYIKDTDLRLKNSVIDFWNVDFLKCKNSTVSKNGMRNRGIQSIRNESGTGYKLSIFNIKSDTVEESESIDVPDDYFGIKEDEINFNIKIGNLFNKHNNIEFENLKILSNDFIEENKTQLIKVRDNMLFNKIEDMYYFYHRMIKTKESALYKSKSKDIKDILNIFKMLSDDKNTPGDSTTPAVRAEITGFGTDYEQYQYDKNYATGYIDLDYQDKGDNTQIYDGDLYYKNY